ncbi:M20/M25/M40 family metallo-hydrolase [Rhodospirillum centenum]|nr:M20/M25/M40 family metallo-hydrolase [Rhodospirillum centenum]
MATARQVLAAVLGTVFLGGAMAGGALAQQPAPPAPAPQAPAAVEPASIPESAIAIARQLQQKALTDPTSYALVESLTTRVGPRLPGTPGDRAAVAWAVQAMKDIGLKNVRTEEVPVVGWLRGGEKAEVLAPAPQPLVVTALGYSAATPPGGITAEIVQFDSFADLRAALPGSLEGKIAFISGRTVRTQDGAGYGAAVVARSRGPAEAAKKGAVGLIIRSIGTESHRLAHTGMVSIEGGLPPLPAAAVSNPDADQLERLLKLGPVRIRLELTPTLPGQVTSHNVIGEIPGREAPEEIVLLGAHLDSWDLGTGAIDDGAGVGIVMGAAKLIGELPQKPRRTLRIVLFAAEEVGLVGAKAYAEAHKAELANHVVGTEADFGAGPVYRFATFFSPEAKAAGEAIQAALAPIGVLPGPNNASGGPDMGPLRRLGVPVVSLAQDGSDYFDVHHTPDDTLDKVDPKKLAQSTAAFATFGWLAAEGRGSFRPTPLQPE